MASAARFPAVEVIAAPPPAPGSLPRVDIAVFAGFAERGPTHVPVALTSFADYRATFGGSLALAYNPETNRVAEAALAPSVAAFFAGGGARCHVIRLARTEASDARWQTVTGQGPETAHQAETGRFPLAALLAGETVESFAAQLDATSPGSWSDRVLLRARVAPTPAAASGWEAIPGGLRLHGAVGVSPGDLVAFTTGAGVVRHHVAVRFDGSDLLLASAGAHAVIEPAGPPEAIQVRAGPNAEPEAATLSAAGGEMRLTFAGAGSVRPGDWLRLSRPVVAIDLLVRGVGAGAVTGRGFRRLGGAVPAADSTLSVLRLDLDIEAGASRTRLSGLGLTPRAANSLWSLTGPLVRGPAPTPDIEGLAARFGNEPLTDADHARLVTAVLPLGLSDRFEAQPMVRHSGRPPLARDGLSLVDTRLFLDPALADRDMNGVARAARSLAHVEGVSLLGLHAAAPLLDGAAEAPALIAVPDLAQGPFAPDAGHGPPPDPLPAPAPETRSGPFGSCAPAPMTPALSGPVAPVAEIPFRLSWPVQPAGVTLVLEEAAGPGFAASVALGDLEPDGVTLAPRPPGHHFYRLAAVRDGLSSDWSAIAVTVRRASFMMATDPADLVAAAAVRRQVQVALLRLAAGAGDLLALLSFAPGPDAAAAAADLVRLAPGAGGADRLGAGEAAALSFGLALDPWLQPLADEAGAPSAMPPEGAVAGAIAARSLAGRAFLSPANVRLAAAGRLPARAAPGEVETLLGAAVAPVWPAPAGPLLLDQPLLAFPTDHPVGEVSTRLLLIRLRRALLAAGQPLVFEPLNDTTRRGLERALDAVLARFARAGALGRAGLRAPYRLAVTAYPADNDQGRLVAEVSLAPAAPVRAVTLQLTLQRAGVGLALAEAAA